MSVLSLLMLQNRESHPVANRKNGRGAPLTTFRITPELHAKAALASELSGKSLNQWAEEALAEKIARAG